MEMPGNQENHGNQQNEGPDAISCQADDGFKGWISNYGGSLVFTTCRSGKLGILGWDGQVVTLTMRQMDVPKGLAVLNEQILVTSRSEVTLFSNAPLLAYDYDPKNPGLYDACYLPRTTWYVGELGAGEVLTDRAGMLFVNTIFSCVSRPSFKYHFESVWKPDFVTELVPENRCNLSGAAVADGRLAYVTAFAKTNTHNGWASVPMNAGILMDARTGGVILEGLQRPCSPRWYKECLWFLNSAAGELCVMNPQTCETKTVCHLPGITRGLTFWGNYAVVGLTKLGKNEENTKFPIRRLNNITYCGVAIVNILTGRTEGMFYFERGCEEIFDVNLLPKVHRAAVLTPDRPACRDAMTTEGFSWWIRESK